MQNPLRLFPVLLFILAALSTHTLAQTQGSAAHLTIYDANVAEVLEERTIELQAGMNQVEWRSLMPKALVRTLRVTAEDAEVVRVDVTYDGIEVRGQRSPVLHLFIQNGGRAGRRRVQVDYLAPDLSWRGDYSLVLDETQNGAPPRSATLDSWVALYNQTGTDVRGGTVDLVAGEVSLLTGAGGYRGEDDQVLRVTSQQASGMNELAVSMLGTSAEATGLSAFSRFRLGRDVALNANAPVSRLPLFQRKPLAVTQRNVFENEHTVQTLGRGGFVLIPRGLEVRLVSKNPAEASMPAGQVTIYARTGGLAQVVGQDRIPLTPPGGEFSVSQGRSSTLFGTRRVLERQQVEYKEENGGTRYKIITKTEIVLTNRSALETEVFVREGVEAYAENRWTILEPASMQIERLGANTFQTRVRVPAGGQTTVTYIIETK
jgi:hypothetical protein